MGDSKRFVILILGTLFIFNIAAWAVVYDLTKSRPLEVNFFDVGQGDSIFIETPEGYQVLIDGGPDDTVLDKLGPEMPFWDRDLDLVVLTHPDHDHIAGLIEVLKRYEVENILWTGVLKDTGEYEEWKRIVSEENANVFIARAGQKIMTQDLYVDVLYPVENLEDKEVSSVNNTSVALLLAFGNNSFLFTGDLYQSAEHKILDNGFQEDVDVLKVGHHGSKTSSSERFIEETNPEIAVISAGLDNKYGHPDEEVLEILKKYDIKVLRTDLDGDIKIFSDGENLIIN